MIHTDKIDQAQQLGTELNALNAAKALLTTSHEDGGNEAVMALSLPPLQYARESGAVGRDLATELMQVEGDKIYNALTNILNSKIATTEEQIKALLEEAVEEPPREPGA